MSKTSPHLRTGIVKALTLLLAFVWVASDAALAEQSRAGSTRSGASSGSSGSSSGSVSNGSSRSGSSSAGASRRSAVQRSGSSSRGSAGAARTRPHGGRSYDRGHGSSHHGSRYYGYYGYYGYPRYWNPFWGFWSFGYGYGPGYGHGYGYYPPVVYSNHRGYRMGALDLKVRPKDTEIYVDGQYVGLAKQYDGFPGHLWLEKGVYEVAFYRPGFETQTRTVKILTDLILDIDIEMLEGRAVKPEMRLEPGAGDEGVDEYVRRSPPVRDRAPAVKQSRMHLDVQPGNASVYLDGNLLGTGDELAGLRAGLILSAGSHTLEVSREGFETLEQRILVEPGEEVELAFELRPLARAGA